MALESNEQQLGSRIQDSLRQLSTDHLQIEPQDNFLITKGFSRSSEREPYEIEMTPIDDYKDKGKCIFRDQNVDYDPIKYVIRASNNGMSAILRNGLSFGSMQEAGDRIRDTGCAYFRNDQEEISWVNQACIRFNQWAVTTNYADGTTRVWPHAWVTPSGNVEVYLSDDPNGQTRHRGRAGENQQIYNAR